MSEFVAVENLRGVVPERVLQSLPRADVKQEIHACWNLIEKNGLVFPLEYCSNCGGVKELTVYGFFCGKCGARMDGDKS